jgi:hypothetical protein
VSRKQGHSKACRAGLCFEPSTNDRRRNVRLEPAADRLLQDLACRVPPCTTKHPPVQPQCQQLILSWREEQLLAGYVVRGLKGGRGKAESLQEQRQA